MEALAKLGIDGWGIFLYLVNFGVLFVLLNKFVFKPLVEFLENRQDQIRTDVDRSRKMREDLEKEREDEKNQRVKRENKLDEKLKDAKSFAKDEVKSIIAKAESQRDTMLKNASNQAEAKIEKVLEASEQETVRRINDVVLHVLGTSVPKEVVEQSVKESWSKITKEA